MKKTPLKNLDLDLYTEKLDNGLTVYIIPNNKVNNIYAQYTTKYGSVDNKFVPIGETEMIEVPKGIAHFLEHKVFEQEDGSDAFDFFGERGADANANTSNYRTTYLFSGCESFYENLDFLQSYVESPYFTDKNVEKEKGIIIQEIGMYKDSPGSVLYENLLYNTIAEHPFRYSVIGTEESVSSITKEDLYMCYNTFYHPSNMFITVTGNVDPEEVLNHIKEHQDKRNMEEAKKIEMPTYEEPDQVYKEYDEKKMNVSMPRFGLAYKFNVEKILEKTKLPINTISKYISIYFGLKGDSTSLLHEELENEGAINYGFGYDGTYLDKHVVSMVHGMARDPKYVIDRIKESLKVFDVKEEDLKRKIKASISNLIIESDNIYDMNEKVLSDVINYGDVVTNQIERVQEYDFNILKEIFDELNFDNSSIYIIYPQND